MHIVFIEMPIKFLIKLVIVSKLNQIKLENLFNLIEVYFVYQYVRFHKVQALTIKFDIKVIQLVICIN